MITLSKFKSSIISSGKRILKVFQYSAKTANECAPFGDDSNPISGMTAIFAETSEIGEPVIVGYVNEKQISAPGEKRLYSLKSDGSESIYIWLRNNGKIEMGGKSHNLVRYTPLNLGISDKDKLINLELVKIATAISTLGGSYTPSDITTDISDSKISEIETL